MKLTEKQIEEIADNLDCGMRCFYNLKTGEIKTRMISMNNVDLDKKVKRLVHSNRYEKGYVCAVDILIQLDYLTKKDYEDWRFGRINYLEKVCNINLSKLTLINKLIRKYSTELKEKKASM